MASRFHCIALKAFDNHEQGGAVVLSADGYARIKQKRPDLIELKYEERGDGKRVGADGKELGAPKPAGDEKKAASEPKAPTK